MSPRFCSKTKGEPQAVFFPTCQVRVVRFYLSSTPPPPPSSFFFLLLLLLLLAISSPTLDCSGHYRTSTTSGHALPHFRTSTTSSRSQWALPDLNHKFPIAVGTTGPQPQHSHTSTTSSRSQWALPDLDHKLAIAVGTTRPQPQVPDRSCLLYTSPSPRDA